MPAAFVALAATLAMEITGLVSATPIGVQTQQAPIPVHFARSTCGARYQTLT